MPVDVGERPANLTRCARCTTPVDLLAATITYEYLDRFISDDNETSDIVVCHRCLSHTETHLISSLTEGGYDSLPDWGRDSDYTQHTDGTWHDDTGMPVDLLGMAYAAMESSGNLP